MALPRAAGFYADRRSEPDRRCHYRRLPVVSRVRDVHAEPSIGHVRIQHARDRRRRAESGDPALSMANALPETRLCRNEFFICTHIYARTGILAQVLPTFLIIAVEPFPLLGRKPTGYAQIDGCG
jgi:hypothetical protein